MSHTETDTLTREQATQLLHLWIDTMRTRAPKRGAGLWLLLDFAEGGFPDRYYECIARPAWEFLQQMDTSKPHVSELQAVLEPVIQPWLRD